MRVSAKCTRELMFCFSILNHDSFKTKNSFPPHTQQTNSRVRSVSCFRSCAFCSLCKRLNKNTICCFHQTDSVVVEHGQLFEVSASYRVSENQTATVPETPISKQFANCLRIVPIFWKLEQCLCFFSISSFGGNLGLDHTLKTRKLETKIYFLAIVNTSG